VRKTLRKKNISQKKMESCDFNCGGKLPTNHSNTLRCVQGFSSSYLFNDDWNPEKYCACWETGINNWWFEQEYIDWRRKKQIEERKAQEVLESSPEWIEKAKISYVTDQIDYLKGTPSSQEMAAKQREIWNAITTEIKENPNKIVTHKCGAMCLPDHISSQFYVCFFCDFRYQPILANPMFRSYFETLMPEMVSILFD
jgi:hypothetical protein